MVNPQKKIREVMFNIHKLSYRIKSIEPDKSFMEKQWFTQVLTTLRQIEDRRDFMHEEIGMDMTMYEEQFFSVIENLMKMHFNKEQLALIQMYLYQLTPDKEWDGTITILTKNSNKEKVVNFKTPNDVWEVINQLDGQVRN